MMAKDALLVSDFKGEKEPERWAIVNDGVMGGLSDSRISFTKEGTAVFEGTLSLENSGGFASVRSRPADFKLRGHHGLLLRVKGDGRSYQARVRTDDRFDGVGYKVDFTTKKGVWTTVRLPFKEFVATYRGRVLPDVEPLDPDKVRQIGFLLADKQAGPFRLEIDWVKAYKDPEKG
jgi:monofunctional biosynthetic peptidoglycan transglycosylase